MSEGRYFILEQPAGSLLLEEPEWKQVCAHHDVIYVVIHQCATGLRDKRGTLCKKPTILVSNSTSMLDAFRGCVCTGNHEHGKIPVQQQHWTPAFAQKLVNGVINLKRSIAVGTFPSASSDACRACLRHYPISVQRANVTSRSLIQHTHGMTIAVPRIPLLEKEIHYKAYIQENRMFQR